MLALIAFFDVLVGQYIDQACSGATPPTFLKTSSWLFATWCSAPWRRGEEERWLQAPDWPCSLPCSFQIVKRFTGQNWTKMPYWWDMWTSPHLFIFRELKPLLVQLTTDKTVAATTRAAAATSLAGLCFLGGGEMAEVSFSSISCAQRCQKVLVHYPHPPGGEHHADFGGSLLWLLLQEGRHHPSALGRPSGSALRRPLLLVTASHASHLWRRLSPCHYSGFHHSYFLGFVDLSDCTSKNPRSPRWEACSTPRTSTCVSRLARVSL